MADFAGIRKRVKNYLLDLPEGIEPEIPYWINKAVQDAENRHNFRHMEATEPFVTVRGVRRLGDVPKRWKETREDPWILKGDLSTTKLAWAPSEDEMIRIFNNDPEADSGEPEFVLERGDTLDAFPFPDGASLNPDKEYRVNLPYWRYSPPLVKDDDTNWFTDNAEHYMVYAAAAEGFLFNYDEARAAVWIGKADIELKKITRVDKRSKLPKRLSLTPIRDALSTASQRRQ